MKTTIIKCIALAVIIVGISGCEESDSSVSETDSNAIVEINDSKYTIAMDTNYQVTYNGGTDLKSLTIVNSENKECSMTILDTTSVANPYGSAYQVNHSGQEPLSKTFKIGDSRSGNVSFYLSWYYYTDENSHVDFSVSCSDLDEIETYAETIGFTRNPYYLVQRRVDYLDNSVKGMTGENDEIKTVRHYDSVGDFSDVLWSGLSIRVGGNIIDVFETGDSIILENVDDIEYRIDTVKNEIEVIIKDREGSELTRIKKTATDFPISDQDYFKVYCGVIGSDGVMQFSDSSIKP